MFIVNETYLSMCVLCNVNDCKLETANEWMNILFSSVLLFYSIHYFPFCAMCLFYDLPLHLTFFRSGSKV